MLADNDAGGVISYAVTGAQFGIGIFLPLVLLLAPLTYTVQELSLRLGAVTQEGFAKLAMRRYGTFWGYYHISTLAFENILTLMTEFIGMTAGLVLLGIPMVAGTLLCLVLITLFVVFTGYWTKERIALLLALLNGTFLVVAFLTHPSGAEIAKAFTAWTLPAGAASHGLLVYVLALIGNAIAPWMIFFQGSGSIDKGVTARDLRFGRIDTAVGAVLQIIVAAGIIVLGASLVGRVAHLGNLGPAQIIAALDRVTGRVPALLFGFGLFNAGFVAAITVALSSSWSIAEIFGWSKSLNDTPRQAPGFYGIYIGCLVIAAGAILIPHVPLNAVAVLTQILGGVLMTPILFFIVLMASDQRLMGEHRTKGIGRAWAWLMVALLVGLTLTAAWQAMAGIRV